jgi:hypothetical protein
MKSPLNTYLLISCVLALSSCVEKQPDNNVQSLWLNGAVHSVKEEFYFASYSFDKIALNEKLYIRYYQFDEKGRFTEFVHQNAFLSRHKKIRTDTLEFIDSLAIDTFRFNDTIPLPDSTNLSVYPKLGEPENENLTEPDYIQKKYKYLNDSVYLVSNFNKHGFLQTYDDCRVKNGKLNCVKTYGYDDRLLSKTDYIYDNKGRPLHKIRYYEKTSYQTLYRYSFGHKYETNLYSAKHSISTFNKAGLLKRQKNYTGNAHVSTAYYTYNEYGHISKLEEKDKISGKIKLTTYRYKYDRQNNWTERLEKRYDGNIFVTRRQIDYR